MDDKSNSSFWPSYVDIMTTLFAIMLVLFVVSFSRFKIKEGELLENNQKLQLLLENYESLISIYSTVGSIDETQYFGYNETYLKHMFQINVEYQTKQYDINTKLKLDLNNKTAADKIIISGKVFGYSEFVYIMLNKPKGVVSASRSPGEKTVVDLVRADMKRKDNYCRVIEEILCRYDPKSVERGVCRNEQRRRAANEAAREHKAQNKAVELFVFRNIDYSDEYDLYRAKMKGKVGLRENTAVRLFVADDVVKVLDDLRGYSNV